MSAPAPKISQFRQRMRSSFATSPAAPILSPVQPATPQAETVTVTQPVVMAPQEINIETKLDVVDAIISRLEEAAPVQESTTAVLPEPPQEAIAPAEPALPTEQTLQVQQPVEPVPEVPPAIVSPPPVHVSSLSKESVVGLGVNRSVAEAGAGMQVVEYEPSSELPVEVESFIEQIQDHQTQQPQEIVITDGQMQIQPAAIPKKSVIVLPITPEVEDAGAKKGPKWSIRWLVEWSRKLMKVFSGKIVYREIS